MYLYIFGCVGDFGVALVGIKVLALQLHVEIGELLQEAIVWSNLAPHAHCAYRIDGGHLATDHQVGQHTRGRPGHAHQAVHQDFACEEGEAD